MKRREFIALLGGAAAAWPLGARAQQSAIPLIGFLSGASPGLSPDVDRVSAFGQGLAETGYFDGRNVAIEYRFAKGQYDQLPRLAADLVRRQVAVILAADGAATRAAKTGSATIPIVFRLAVDPVAAGFVRSLSRPGGNVTGVTTLNLEVGPKRLEFLHELIPTTSIMAALVNPTNPGNAETLSSDLQATARRLGLQLHILRAGTNADIDAAFETLTKLQAGGLVIGTDPFFGSRYEKLAALALRYRVPAIYQWRGFVTAGGLMSYGGSFADSYRLAGVYTGRILKGEKPADLPVQQATKIELFVNLKTAKALGVEVPTSLVLRADEVIE
jgi:putative ABC transport system substrate-binding protein